MKSLFSLSSFFAMMLLLCSAIKPVKTIVKTNEIKADSTKPQSYFIDIHNLEPGKVIFEDVMKAHQKDLETQDKYNVTFLKFWIDEKQGKVYCLSKANDSASVKQTHKEAHGLMPSIVYDVTEGQEASAGSSNHFFIDVHEMGAGKVTANDVAAAHAKDLQVQNKYHVNFINYWIDEKKGTIMCLSEAPDADAVKKTHGEAHGLLPAYMLEVKQGQ